jgi:Undecaprenyl-phosphate glucose phosphotransferase
MALALLAVQAIGLALARIPVARFVGWSLASRATERRAAVVGGGGNADRLIRGLKAQPDNDIRIVAMFDDRGDERSPPMVAGCRKLGTVSELIAFARVAEIDMVIVTLPLSAEQRILSLLKALWVLPVDIRLSAYSSDYAFARRESALIGVVGAPLSGVRRSAKRAFDILFASLALLVLWPVMLATAVAIRLDSPGPVLFFQKRHGFNHRPVDVWKFRSMHHADADPLARTIVTRGDPRVTMVGRFIRKTSIDELPQLFNVLLGDLSLVGPRPHAINAQSSRQQLFAEIVEGYSGRHKVPPGITGWAQVSGWRGEIDDPEKLRQRFEHDLFYIENWSLWLDLKILLMTPLRLLDTRPAY